MLESLETSLSGKLWPIHFKPEEDELLSSWLCRLALSHGLHPSTLCSIILSIERSSYQSNGKALWHGDIDKGVRARLLGVLADRTGTGIERVRNTTLAAYDGWIYERLNAAGRSHWVMPINSYNNSGAYYGLQYCPRCLSEDKEPYFRRDWRMAFITFCVKHCTQLLDRCTECKEPVNYRKGIYGSLNSPPIGGLTLCHSCKIDIRDAALNRALPPEDLEIAFQSSLARTILEGGINILGSGPVYSHLYFIVLHKLMVLLASGTKGGGLRQYVCHQYGNRNLNPNIGNNKISFIERLDVGERRGLLGMAREILSDWPNRFIDFCQATNLSVAQLLTSMEYVPFWYWRVVNEHLNQRRYGRTEQETESALRYLYKEYEGNKTEADGESIRRVSKFLKSVPSAMRTKIWRRMGGSVRRLKANRGSTTLYGYRVPSKYEVLIPKPISDDIWKKVIHLIPRVSPRKRQLHDRTALDGILYVLSTGCPWGALPAEFCKPEQVYKRYKRWKKADALKAIWEHCSYWYERNSNATPAQTYKFMELKKIS